MPSDCNRRCTRKKKLNELGKNWEKTQDGFWQTREMTHLLICLKISIIQKGGKIFNINFQLLTSFFFVCLFDFESNLDTRAKVSLTNL